jgi:alpha-1,6-mannosyltransferase
LLGLKALDITKFFGETTGGIRTYLLEKAKYVQGRDDLRQVVVIPAKHDSMSDTGDTRWYRIAALPIPTQFPYRLLLSRKKVQRILQKEGPDIIEVGSPYLVPWITRKAAATLGIPLVWFYHTNFPRIISPRPDWDGFFRRSAGRLADRYVARLAPVFDAAIGASQVAVDALTRAGFRRTERIPLGVSLSLFHPDRRANAEATRRARGLPDGPLAIFTGRFAREKELSLVIDAWPRVEKATGATLVLVGDGPSREYFQRRCKAARVIWLPFETDRERLADLLACADIYVAPGPAETFGLAALEALASGVPVVCSDQGAVRELVEASGAGVVNPEPDAPVMAESIVALLGQDLERLGRLGRWHAEQHHSWEIVFDRLFRFYQHVISDHRA